MISLREFDGVCGVYNDNDSLLAAVYGDEADLLTFAKAKAWGAVNDEGLRVFTSATLRNVTVSFEWRDSDTRAIVHFIGGMTGDAHRDMPIRTVGEARNLLRALGVPLNESQPEEMLTLEWVIEALKISNRPKSCGNMHLFGSVAAFDNSARTLMMSGQLFKTRREVAEWLKTRHEI